MASAQAQDNLVDRVSRAVGVRLPDGYEAKVKEFVNTNKVLKDEDAADFTVQFIAKEMEKDWKIDKQSQLLFLWHCVYSEITGSNLYNGEGGNAKIKEDFNAPGTNLRIRANKFKFQKELIAEADRRIAEADRRSAETDKEIIEITYERLKYLTEFYRLYKKNPSTVMPNEISHFNNSSKHIIANCKKYNIDYKAELRKELGDDKKVAELLKFYGVE